MDLLHQERLQSDHDPSKCGSHTRLNNAYTQASILAWTKDKLDIYEYWRMEETSDRYNMQEEYDKGRRDEQRKTILAMSAKGQDAVFIADTLNLKVDFVQQVLVD